MADNAALAGLMARPEATQNMVSVADMMRNKQLAAQQIAASQQQVSASQGSQQLTQEEVKELQLKNQMEQIDLQNQQAWGKYYENPDQHEQEPEGGATSAPAATPGAPAASIGAGMGQNAPNVGSPVPAAPTATPQKTTFAEDMLGLSPDDPLAKQTNAAIRAGVNPTVGAHSAMSMAQSLLGFRTSVLKQTADKQAVVKDGLTEINKILAPIGAEKDPTKQAAMLQAAEPELEKASTFDPTLHQAVMGIDPQHLSKVLNLTGGMQDVLEYGTKQAQQLEAQQKTAVPTDQQRKDAIGTIATYSSIPKNMQQGFAQEIINAPTLAAQEKIQDRADKANESFQRSADARAQADSLKDVSVRKAIADLSIKADSKLDDDLSNTRGIRNEIDMSKGGNEMASAAAMQRFAEHEVKEGGINRFNEMEQKALGPQAGSLFRNMETWAVKGYAGKQPDVTFGEINSILDAEDKIAMQKHDTSLSSITNRMSNVVSRGSAKAESAVKSGAAQHLYFDKNGNLVSK
jgi:hypothetical protein